MSLYEGIPTNKQKKLDEKSWAPKHKAVFGEESRMIHESVFGEKGKEEPKSDKELVDKARQVKGTAPAPTHESVFGKEERIAAPIHESVLGKAENTLNSTVEQSFEKVEDAPVPEDLAQEEESAGVDETQAKEPEITQEQREAADLAAVRERLGMAPKEERFERSGLWDNSPGTQILSDPEYSAISKGIYDRNREKDSDLIRVEAEREYQRRFPEKYNEYLTQEVETIYRDPSGKPQLQDDQTFNRWFSERQFGGSDYRKGNWRHEKEAREILVREFPKKAKAYAETDAHLREILERREKRAA